MNQRFEIPVEPQGYNIFQIDDYLRSLRSHEERVKLINSVGYSAEKREEFERSRGLPHGAVELALVCEDKQIAELNQMVNKKMNRLYEEKASPEQINEAFTEIGSRAAGIRALYPEAFQFLMQYTSLAKRNAASFRGDYRFNNEYKIIQADCSPSSNVLSCGPDPVNVCVNFNLVVFAYVGVLAWVAIAEFLAFAIYIWAVVFVIP
jgi:radical SAM superfamily enzyme YgiQ (UPF0313 family)